MPFDGRGKHRREPCPEGGHHSYGEPYLGRECKVTWCRKCRNVVRVYFYHSPPDYRQVEADIEAAKAMIREQT